MMTGTDLKTVRQRLQTQRASVGAAPSLTVASWNIQSIRGASTDRLERQAVALARHDPDLVTLQEVGSRYDLPNRLRDCLVQVGLRYFLFSGPQTPTDKAQTNKQYGNVIASRLPLRSRSWPIQTTWPQLIISAEFDWSESPVLIVSAHIPNGRGNGWEKVYALEALAAGLTQITMPTILTGDFNEPKRIRPIVVSFGADDHGGSAGMLTRRGVTYARRRWMDAVDAVLTPRSREDGGWGGQHVVYQTGAEFEATHLVNGRAERYFDHILTSGSIFQVRSVAFDHTVREPTNPLSDHSIIVAGLEPPSVSRQPC
jgi:endonuclease/exonuclease/phosphatase family metal-dependent hydrolase